MLPANRCWCQNTRVIAFSCGIKITAVHCLILLQSTRVTDRRTEISYAHMIFFDHVTLTLTR